MSLLKFFKPMERQKQAVSNEPVFGKNDAVVIFCHPTNLRGDFKTGCQSLSGALVKDVLGPFFVRLGPLIALNNKGHVEITDATTFGDIAENGVAHICPDIRQKRKKD